jgi:hypothetical protein
VAATLKLLRIVQFVMLGSILLYAALGEIMGSQPRGVNPALSYMLSTAAVAIIGMIFVVRRTLVFRSAESLALHPDDPLILNHWKTGYIATYALCEALGLFGLILRFMGSNFQQSALFYLGGLILLAFFGPRRPVAS